MSSFVMPSLTELSAITLLYVVSSQFRCPQNREINVRHWALKFVVFLWHHGALAVLMAMPSTRDSLVEATMNRALCLYCVRQGVMEPWGITCCLCYTPPGPGKSDMGFKRGSTRPPWRIWLGSRCVSQAWPGALHIMETEIMKCLNIYPWSETEIQCSSVLLH